MLGYCLPLAAANRIPCSLTFAMSANVDGDNAWVPLFNKVPSKSVTINLIIIFYLSIYSMDYYSIFYL